MGPGREKGKNKGQEPRQEAQNKKTSFHGCILAKTLGDLTMRWCFVKRYRKNDL